MSLIDGLSSGLDTTAIINALLDVERLPQDRLVERRARSESAAEQLSAMRTSVNGLKTAASDLRLSSGWEQLKGTTSNESVSVETTAGGFTGTIAFTVDSLATTNVMYSTDTVESLDTVVGSGGSLSAVVEAINADTELNFEAVAIQTGDGYRLQLSAKEGGADSAIVLDNSLFDSIGGFTTLTEGADAQITFQGINPYSVTSSTNDFAGIIPGVNVTVSEVSVDPVTVTVQNDFEAIADSVQAFVEQFNEIKSTMSAATLVDPNLETQVPLAFNSNVRRSEQSLLRALVDPVSASSIEAPSLAGISLQRDGTVSFDREKFLAAAVEDIDDLSRMFISPGGEGDEAGILDRMVAAADEAAAFGTGLLSSAEESEKARIEDYTDQIDTIEDRLIAKEAQLRRIYTDLEVALGNLNDQSNWLSSQLSTLGTGSAS